MNLILLTLLSACTPWKGHRDLATVESPIEASLVQSEFRFFTIEGTKVIAFPIFGCSAKIELVTDEHTFQVDYIKGSSGGMWRSCPGTRTGELLSSPDGKYLAVNINSGWKILQNTPQGLFPVSTPTGFTGSASDWNSVSDVTENPADLLLYQHGSWKNKSTIHYNTLELVKTQSSSEQRAFLSQTVATISTYDWTELYAGLEPTDQSELIDELINVFLEETSNVDVDSSSNEHVGFRKISEEHIALRKILVPLVNANDHIELLTRLIENQYFQSDKEFATVYAKVWTVDPALSGKQACLHITADPRRAYHSTQRKADIALFTLASKTSCEALPSVFEDAELKPCCDDDCTWDVTLSPIQTLIEGLLVEDMEHPDLNTVYRYYLESQGTQDLDKFTLAHLRSKYVVDQQESTDCVGVYEPNVSCAAPEEKIQEIACLQTIDSSVSPIDYTFTVNDDDQTIQNIQSTGKLSEPTAVIVPGSSFWTKSTMHTKEDHAPEQNPDEPNPNDQSEGEQNTEESDIGYSCSLEGTFPFYGKLNKVTAEWTVNGTVVEIKEDAVDKLIDYLGRTLSSPKLEGYSSNSLIKNTAYKSGDTLGCTLKVTKAAKTSLDTIVKTKGLGISRSYTAESMNVP